MAGWSKEPVEDVDYRFEWDGSRGSEDIGAISVQVVCISTCSLALAAKIHSNAVCSTCRSILSPAGRLFGLFDAFALFVCYSLSGKLANQQRRSLTSAGSLSGLSCSDVYGAQTRVRGVYPRTANEPRQWLESHRFNPSI